MRLESPMSDGFTRIVQFAPAHHCELMESDRNRSHGIGSMRLAFILLGPLGAVQWMVDTGWYCGGDAERCRGDWDHEKPHPWDLGYHSPNAQYEGQSSRECDLLPGGVCYYDGSSLNAEPHREPFVRDPESVWTMLMDYYRSTFRTGRPGGFAQVLDSFIKEQEPLHAHPS